MKSFSKIILVGFIMLAFFACDKDDNQVGQVEGTSGINVISAPDTVNANSVFRVQLTVGTPNPCYELRRVEVNEMGNRSIIRAYTSVDPEIICITTLGEIKTVLDLSLSEKGQHLLIVNPNTQFQIIDTVFVK